MCSPLDAVTMRTCFRLTNDWSTRGVLMSSGTQRTAGAPVEWTRIRSWLGRSLLAREDSAFPNPACRGSSQ